MRFGEIHGVQVIPRHSDLILVGMMRNNCILVAGAAIASRLGERSYGQFEATVVAPAKAMSAAAATDRAIR